MSNSTTIPTVSPLVRDLLYKFNLRIAETKARKAIEFESRGEPAQAGIQRYWRDYFLAEALKYAPVEVVAAQSFDPVTGIAVAFDYTKVEMTRQFAAALPDWQEQVKK